jgi:putative addiction module killer protein
MVAIRETSTFRQWLDKLRDEEAKLRITVRIRRLAEGNAGDTKALGRGLSELRIHYGPGYRVYLAKRGERLVVLLAGGDKRTQWKDIDAARLLLEGLTD